MGDWYYYVTLLKFVEVANRVYLPEEIDQKYKDREALKLGDWIQREIDSRRIRSIVDYLNNQPQRFFNSLILGLYGGNPSWQGIDITISKLYEEMPQLLDSIDYLSDTFGILNLDGSEDIFAIDGQHRAIGIREAVRSNQKLGIDEVPVVFIAHRTDDEGVVRTRRLFSTLNRYAKPVNKSEIIALSEDNNCSIITRQLIDDYPPLSNRILINKNRSLHPENTSAFTNILTLYDLVETTITNKKVHGIPVEGRLLSSYTTRRKPDEIIANDFQKFCNLMDILIESIPSFSNFIRTGEINRKGKNGNLIFRPIGQNIIFNVLKVAESYKLFDRAINFFGKDDFDLSHKVWEDVFWDDETGNIITEKSRQRYASLLILEKIGFEVNRTRKDSEIFQNFGFTIHDL